MREYVPQKPVQEVDPVKSKDEEPVDPKQSKKHGLSGMFIDDKADPKGSKKKDEEELVSWGLTFDCQLSYFPANFLQGFNNILSQSEEDQTLKDNLEMIVERIRVRIWVI